MASRMWPGKPGRTKGERRGEEMADDIPFLRTSERGAFHRCWQQWWWAFREGLTPKGKQADARWFGVGVHIALAEWYQRGTRRGPHPADTFEEWVGDEIAYVKTWLGSDYEESAWVDAAELGISMLTGYVDHYGRDDQWEIISIEQPFKVRITREGKPVAIFSSRWDGVIRDRRTRKVLLLENKTASQVVTRHLEGDNQALSYLAVANQVLRAKKVLKPGDEIGGIQYNFLRKAMADERPVNEQGYSLNKDGSVSKNQPTPRFVRPDPIMRSQAEMRAQLDRMADEVGIMNQIKAGTLPLTISRTRDCPYCDFWDMCILRECGGDGWKEIRKASYTVNDPYVDIRENNPVKSASE
jgi:Zierdtviridae exonuclease